jgi:molecular chaperone DnaJ
MRGLGMPDVHGRGNGDLFVTVTIIIPTKLSHKQRELLEKFDE